MTPGGVSLPVVVNGERRETPARTLGELCLTLGLDAERIATAVNGDFVPLAARASRRLAAHDQIEIVSPRQGG